MGKRNHTQTEIYFHGRNPKIRWTPSEGAVTGFQGAAKALHLQPRANPAARPLCADSAGGTPLVPSIRTLCFKEKSTERYHATQNKAILNSPDLLLTTEKLCLGRSPSLQNKNHKWNASWHLLKTREYILFSVPIKCAPAGPHSLANTARFYKDKTRCLLFIHYFK